MKKTLILITCLALMLTFVACGGAGNETGGNDSENVQKPGDTMTLEEIFSDILKDIPNLPAVENTTITDLNFESFLFTYDWFEGYEALASEALISAIAHSAVLLRVPEGVDVQTVADEIEANADPRKWICVEAEKTIVKAHGQTILFVMSSAGTADAITANFDALWDIESAENSLRENQVILAAKKIEEISESHPESVAVFYSIIPDKNYYPSERDKSPSLDYDRLAELMFENVSSAEYIDIFGCLDGASYYPADIHWRQESLFSTAQTLCDATGAPCAPPEDYTQGEAAPDMYYFTSEATENAIVTSAEQEGEMPVYALDKLSGDEPYDIFLSGAQAVITIENENAKTNRELIIFRDSFGSSLAPLLIDSYSKITLFDLRYISTSIIDDYADFEGADVLFIYSTLMINSGGMLR